MSKCTTCPNCGPQLNTKSDISITSSGGLSRADTITLVGASAVSQLRRLNELRSATASLPNEILDYIFSLFCHSPPPSRLDHFPRISRRRSRVRPRIRREVGPVFVLCAVSSQWRNVAISASHLWVDLTIQNINSFRQHLEASDMSELLQTFLSRASGALLNLNLDWEEEDLLSESTNPDPMHPTDPLLRTVFIKHPSRFRSLTLAWKWSGNYFDHLYASFTSLVELHIKFVSSDIDRQIPATFFLQLTSLHLTSVTIFTCLTLLSQSPNLMQFHCGYIVRESISDIMKRPMVMSEKLEWFDWKSPDAELSDVAVLKRCQFPQLKKLTWDALNAEYEFSQYLSSFIDFIPPKLIHLELVMKDGCANSVRRILASNPQIKKLSLIGSTLDLPPFFPPFLDCFESLPTVRALYLETDDEAFSDTTKERLRKLIRDGREVVIRAGEELVDLNSEHY